MEETFRFDAPWGTLLKVMTSLVTLLLMGIFGWIAMSGRATTPLHVVLYICVPLGIIFGSVLFVIRGYTIAGNELLIRRLFWNTRISLAGFKSARFDPKAMTGAIRTFGNGGFYSFSGKYRSGKLGSFRAFVNDFRNCVIIETGWVTLVVSPENPQYFVEVLQSMERSSS